MSDPERALLAKVVNTGQVEQAIASGIEEDHFADQECQQVWGTLTSHYHRYRVAPSTEVVRRSHPAFPCDIQRDSFAYLKDEFIRALKRRKAIETGRMLMQAIDDESQIERIEEVFVAAAQELVQLLPTEQVGRFSDMKTRIELYKELREKGAMPGLTFGVPKLDDYTFGIQSHEYISVTGFSGLGKSTFAQHVLFSQYLHGATPLIFSLEMEADALLRKWDTMAVNFQYRALKAMKLGNGDMAQWEQWAERAEKAANDIIILDTGDRGWTLDRIYAETSKWKPSITCVDYITLLDTPRHAGNAMWERVTWLTRNIKMMVRALKIPLIGIAQSGREAAKGGAELDNIAYSKSIVTDSDIVIGLYQDQDGAMEAQKKMEVRLQKNRDGAKTNIDMYWDMNTMSFREWSPADMFVRDDVPARVHPEIAAVV